MLTISITLPSKRYDAILWCLITKLTFVLYSSQGLCAFLIEKEADFTEHKQMYYRYSQYIIFYLNNFILDHPSERLFSSSKYEERYKDFYNRWLACVVLPGTFRT